MWRCPVCGQTFVTRNMPHSCFVRAARPALRGPAAGAARRDHLRAHLVLKRRIDDPRLAVEYLEPHYYLHRFTLTGPADVDAELTAWVAEAYRVGAQLTAAPQPAAPPAPDPPTPGSR